MYKAMVCVIFFAACSCHPKHPSDALVARCSPVLTEIIEVQDLRGLNSFSLQQERERNELTAESASEYRDTEVRLASRVNKLYAVARRLDCFRGTSE
jgi:hypothetical protein